MKTYPYYPLLPSFTTYFLPTPYVICNSCNCNAK